ncbi:MAG TPA: hypothetical protein VFW38_06545 [Solirubrobacteraceae bacterium]|nr:hypothetical protein [Solirubrobacteraceae bacterium]
MSRLQTLAPAKINLGLFVGPLRADGKHELVSVMQPISLADRVRIESLPIESVARASEDEVICPGVDGENLAAAALELFRSATGWKGGPVRVSIDKRIPVAAGLGGGSADAGAALRLAQAASGLGDAGLLLELAAQLGADVPAQVAPRRTLALGAGERLQALVAPSVPLGVLVLAQRTGLSTASVYAQVDRLQAPRDSYELGRQRDALRAALAAGVQLPAAELLANDLQEASRQLSGAVAPALAQARDAGADRVFVSGSGPTVVGLFEGEDGPRRAQAAAAGLAGRAPAAVAAETVNGDFAAVRPLRA